MLEDWIKNAPPLVAEQFRKLAEPLRVSSNAPDAKIAPPWSAVLFSKEKFPEETKYANWV